MTDKAIILLIEDNAINLRLTRTVLVKHGFEVLTATSAENALEILSAHHPDLILTDIQLPGIDGLQLVGKLKQNSAYKDIIVIALTAYASKLDEERALAAGCDGFIAKPYQIMSLAETIRGYLGK